MGRLAVGAETRQRVRRGIRQSRLLLQGWNEGRDGRALVLEVTAARILRDRRERASPPHPSSHLISATTRPGLTIPIPEETKAPWVCGAGPRAGGRPRSQPAPGAHSEAPADDHSSLLPPLLCLAEPSPAFWNLLPAAWGSDRLGRGDSLVSMLPLAPGDSPA